MLKNKNLYLLLGVLLLLLFLLSLTANLRFIISSRATQGKRSFSVENSYLFASPVEAKADKSEKIRVTIFLLNAEGLGVGNEEVILKKAPELIQDQIQTRTDNYGRAIFDLYTISPGEYMVLATVDGVTVGEGIKIKFK